jgi:hypothetical protein
LLCIVIPFVEVLHRADGRSSVAIGTYKYL